MVFRELLTCISENRQLANQIKARQVYESALNECKSVSQESGREILHQNLKWISLDNLKD